MAKSDNILYNFLKSNNVDIDISIYLNFVSENPEYAVHEGLEICENIIVDAYKGFSEDVKSVAETITQKTGVYLGRKQKIVIKKMLDYKNFEDLPSLNCFLSSKIDIQQIVLNQRKHSKHQLSYCKHQYFDNLNNAIRVNDNKRVSDYLNFIYSRLLVHSEYKNRRLTDLFEENKKHLLKVFTEKQVDLFNHQIKKNDALLPYAKTVALYNKLYIEFFIHEKKNLNDVVIIQIDQRLFDRFKNKEVFLSYCYELISKSYEQLKNHKTLVLKVNNIIHGNLNLKWELYSSLSIYAENCRKHIEKRSYYKPEVICFDYLEHKYGLSNKTESKEILKKFYRNETELKTLKNELGINVTREEMEFFKSIYNGFQFVDCFILKKDIEYKNSKEIDFIKNQSELLLILSKNSIDDRKIPCPVCSSLKISGNSYPEVGIKSWECKNELCSERSKTNRGKRYSLRSVEMQNGLTVHFEQNKISKELIAKWRKDVVLSTSYDSIYQMCIQYFSYHDGNVLFLNFDKKNINLSDNLKASRNIRFMTSEKIVDFNDFNNNVYSEFEGGELYQKFLYDHTKSFTNDTPVQLGEKSNYFIENEDCLQFLKRVPKNTIHHMVTSPPYYNAREYSQWKNLYNYLHDMYTICQASFDAMVPGGVFFYNIGDIFDNPNTVVKSKMGEKRVALGAYLILLFRKAGFELLDNIIWFKGEPQSNRHKNDGNYTPYYQRPANSYEHMFIFKKPGKLLLSNDPIISNNIQKFSPVIKINNKGVNLFGHTAPYPVDLPLLSIKSFTNKGDTVFDPFLGSGTSVYTAVNNERIGIGTEMDSEYFKLAKRFIEKETSTLKLF